LTVRGTLPENTYNEHAWIIGDPSIGEGTWIGAFTVIDGSGGLRIGRGCDISCGVQIYTHSTVRRCVSGRAVDEIDREPVSIGDHVFVGAQAVVMMGVSIGDRAVVAAGAVVTSDVPADTVVAGVPARPIGKVVVSAADVRIEHLP
jgi:acetyltransferase-like isoleucine patch superfamily enzyme